MKLLRIFLAVLASAAGVAATYLVSAGVNKLVGGRRRAADRAGRRRHPGRENMSESKHTLGPWLYVPDAPHYTDAPWIVWGPKGPGHGIIAHASPYGRPHLDEQREEVAANARLIAAAPDLLFALRSLRDGDWMSYLPAHINRLILDALDRADGK